MHRTRSTNCPIHITAIARHIGVDLDIEEWQSHGHDIPLLVNCQPAGEYLMESFYRAGGIPAIMKELMKHKKITEDEAYQILRKMAMDKNKRITDVAEGIISAIELLE